MRLNRLALERYGPFTDRAITFRADARLHVVIGANEAGKTSALAAVTDLLFGIEHRTRHAYRHDMNQLRLGAEIEAADGTRFAFRRRKGQRNTLVDGADAALPEDALAPFLRGMTRDVFCRAFGLDAEGLRAGGQEMMAVNGEVGASLFAAGSGLRGYHALQAGLDAEAQRIFAPRRAKDRSFYQALDRHDEARKAIRATELREGAWRDLNEAYALTQARLDGIAGHRQRIAAERARLERLKRVAPLLAAIDAAQARADAVGDMPAADASGIARLGAALECVRAGEQDHARHAAALASAQADLDALGPASPLLALAEPILERFRGIDRFDKDGQDLPRVQTEVARLDEELARLAVRVGLPDPQALVRTQPSDGQRARIEDLVREGRDRAAERERRVRDRAAALAERVGHEQDQPGAGPVVDPEPLREALAGFAGLRKDLTESAQLEATIANAANVVRGQAARMLPPVADPAGLAQTPLPAPDRVARFRGAFEALERAHALALQRCDDAEDAAATARARLHERAAGRAIATRADLEELRRQRDSDFAGLRDALAGGARAAPADVAAYERRLGEADRLADALVDDAERVAAYAADQDRLARAEAEAEAARIARAEVAQGRGELDAEWVRLWQPSGVAPGEPAEMTQWLAQAAAVIEAEGDLDARRIDARIIAKRIAAARAPLEALARQAGLADPADLDVGALLARIEERVAASGRRWEAARDVAARLRATAAQIARHDAALEATQVEATAWQAQWAAALPAIGLSERARIGEAEAALAAWRDVPAVLREQEGAQRRVRGMLRDREAYRQAVVELCAAAPDLDVAAPSSAIRALHRRLQAAQVEETRRAELARRREETRGHAARAARAGEAAHADLTRTLTALDPALAGRSPDEAEALHAALQRRHDLRADLAAKRAELARAAEGTAEAGLRAELAATSLEAIEGELARLEAERDANDRDGQVAYADRQDAERRRAACETGTGSEIAVAQRRAAEAELAACARQWAVLRVAHLMLGTAIGRYRAGQQDPLLSSASAAFRALTGGGFDGLTQDYGEGDEPRIVGRRASGETVPVEGLSEGTRDQLYLALRLAYLRDYATRNEPAPFLGDDLFLTFDDARTAHGLDALADIADGVQAILFTHHRHVADLAQARLGARVDVVEL